MIDTRGNLIEMSKEMQLFNASIVFDHQQTTTEIQRDDFTFFFLESFTGNYIHTASMYSVVLRN